ncbi:MAG: hypothetical protein HF973_02865 [Chloroflexi bacterium]|nr:hypothetical protein [Chloroflexota bacterium]
MNRRLLILLILLTAFALRVIGISGASPPGVEHDEVANWLIDRSILDEGNLSIYYTRAYGHEGLFHVIQAASVALLGDNLLALRLPAAFAGLLGVAITYTLTKLLFAPERKKSGEYMALAAAGLLAVLFWPVFYGRLGLRAIWLPVFSGLSAIFWQQAWSGKRFVAPSPPHLVALSFVLAGIMAGLGVNTYMAGRALPIFYALFILYLALFHWGKFRQKWQGILFFALAFGAVSAPLFVYLQTNPGAEFRVAEVAAPLEALKAGDVQPILANGVKIVGVFGFAGDPLWRQNVAGQPVFGPLLAILFYAGVFYALWRWREARFAFLLLWLGTAVIPSLVTIDAPSSIRMINALVVITIFPALFIHISPKLSTVFPNLSTKTAKLVLTILFSMFFLFYLGRTARDIFVTWPNGGEVPFVWQTAFRDTAVFLDKNEGVTAVSLAGWSPDTMDAPSMALLLRRDDVALSHFNPQEGSLILPAGQPVTIFRPTDLPLDPYWEEKLAQWGATTTTTGLATQYAIRHTPPIQPQFSQNTFFGSEIRFLGYDLVDDSLVTYWQIERVPANGRRLFVHFLDAEGNVLVEDYHFDTEDPQGLWFPHWQAGDTILQRHSLPTGTESIRLGWFDPATCTPGPCQNLTTETGEPYLVISHR